LSRHHHLIDNRSSRSSLRIESRKTAILLLIVTTLVTPIDNHPRDSPSELTVINRVIIVQFTVIIVVMDVIR